MELTSAEGTTLMLDAGTGARALGYALSARAGGEPMRVHVAFSHYHWDHLQGLPFFAPLYSGSNTVCFYAAAPTDRPDDSLHRLLSGQMSFPYFPVPFSDLAAITETTVLTTGEMSEIGPFAVRPFPVHHPQGAHGYRVELGGRSVVYATDHEHGNPSCDAGLRDVSRGADLLISDAQYTPEEYPLRAGWGHTTWQHAAHLAVEAGVGRLLLFHHDPAHDDAALERILAQAREIFPATDLAKEGLEITL